MRRPSKLKKLRFAVIASDTVLFAVLGGELKVLLVKVNRPPYYAAHWGVPGGLINPRETAEAAARRHLKNKGRVEVPSHLEQLFTWSRVNRDPRGRVIAVSYLALISGVAAAKLKLANGTAWFPVGELPRLAFDHREMIAYALRRLRARLEYTNIAGGLLPREFVLSDLQKVYEIALGKRLDKRNFVKKILSLGIVRSLGRKRRGEASRPAQLYAFKDWRLKIAKIL